MTSSVMFFLIEMAGKNKIYQSMASTILNILEIYADEKAIILPRLL